MRGDVTSLELTGRCSRLLKSVGGLCTWSHFDEGLSFAYDPQKRILVIKDEEERKAEAQTPSSEQEQTQTQTDEQPNAFQGGPGRKPDTSPGGLLNSAANAGWLITGAAASALTGAAARLAGKTKNIFALN